MDLTDTGIDHRQFIAKLPGEDRRRLTAASDYHGLRHCIAHWAAIVFIGTMIVHQVVWWPLLVPVQGLLIVFLFSQMHETVHRTAFATRRLNDWVAATCGLMVLLPSNWFRYFHMAHHRHTQDPEKDPELTSTKPQTVRQYLMHLSGMPLWRSHGQQLWRNAMGGPFEAFVPKSSHYQIVLEARVLILIYAILIACSMIAGTLVLVYVWVLPALLGQPFLRAFLLAEHSGCPYVANAFQNTRTTLTHRIVRVFTWNMSFHAEHHAYPAVPFHRLPALHQLMNAYIHHSERGYRRFHTHYLQRLRDNQRLSSSD